MENLWHGLSSICMVGTGNTQVSDRFLLLISHIYKAPEMIILICLIEEMLVPLVWQIAPFFFFFFALDLCSLKGPASSSGPLRSTSVQTACPSPQIAKLDQMPLIIFFIAIFTNLSDPNLQLRLCFRYRPRMCRPQRDKEENVPSDQQLGILLGDLHILCALLDRSGLFYRLIVHAVPTR